MSHNTINIQPLPLSVRKIFLRHRWTFIGFRRVTLSVLTSRINFEDAVLEYCEPEPHRLDTLLPSFLTYPTETTPMTCSGASLPTPIVEYYVLNIHLLPVRTLGATHGMFTIDPEKIIFICFHSIEMRIEVNCNVIPLILLTINMFFFIPFHIGNFNNCNNESPYTAFKILQRIIW